MSVSKKPTRSPTGMPFARKSEILGMHSIPVGTTPVSLKNRLQGVFPPHLSAEKRKKRRYRRKNRI